MNTREMMTATSSDNSNQGKNILPMCATMAIGTVPQRDPVEAVDFILENNQECPTWPQLPLADFREGMYVQFSEGMPAAVLDVEGRKIFFDSEAAPDELAAYYEETMSGDMRRCRISPEYARAFEILLERMPDDRSRFIKGQVTGPASFGLTVTDENGKPVLYHADLFEAIVGVLACKGGWQEQRFREVAPDLETIVFFDEPYLTQVGSAMISLPPEDVVANLKRCFEAIDGLTGIHVCGGTDWGLLSTTGVDILHFDAWDHAKEFLIYERELEDFLARGGMIAWGIVPTDERASETGAEALAAEVAGMADRVSSITGGSLSREDVLARSFISEACGMGTLDSALAERCFSLADQVSHVLKKEIC